MKILVTGGNGFIGTELCRALHEAGREVVSYDRELRAEALPWEEIQGDVADYDGVKRAMVGVEAVVHLAAVASVGGDWKELNVTNILGTSVVASEAKEAGVKRFVFASSAAVYGDYGTACREGQELRPKSLYGVTKACGEELVGLFHPAASILRFFNVYGRGQKLRGAYPAVVPAFVSRAVAGEPLEVYGDRSTVRDFVHVSDVVYVIMMALLGDPLPSVVNVGTGEAVEIGKLATFCARVAGQGSDVKLCEAREGDILHSVADTSVMDNYGMVSTVDLWDELRKYIQDRVWGRGCCGVKEVAS